MPAACAPIDFIIPDTYAARRQRAQAGRRLHRDDPARHRRRLRRAGEGHARPRHRRALRHHQRALAGRPPRRWPALGDVLLLRRRTRRQPGERRPQPRQQPDLDGDHPARRNPRSRLSGHVHAMGAAPRQRGAGLHRGGLGAIYEIEALAQGGADVFLLGERGKLRARSASLAAAARRSTASAGRRMPASSRRRWPRKVTDVKIARGQRVRLETPGGGGWGDPLARDPASVARDVRLGYIARSAARDDYAVVLSPDGVVDIAETRRCAPGGRHERRSTIVGVDVGGTFTDLFFFDEAERRFRTAKVPSNRGDEAVGFLEGLRVAGAGFGARLHRPRHHRRHQRAAGAQGREDRRHHHARLPRRARDAPPRPAAHLGTVGRFPAHRRPRHAASRSSERTLADGTHPRCRWTPTRCRAAARDLLAARRAGARDHLHQRLRQPGQRARRGGGRARRLAERRTSSTPAEILPEIREFERASTTALNAYLQPVVGSTISASSRRRCRAMPSAGEFHIVQSNGGVMSTATARQLPGAHGAVGPRGRRDRGGGHRARGRLSRTSSPATSAAPRSTCR